MVSTSEKVRQLAPHWAVMFVVMYGLLAVVRSVHGDPSFVESVVLVVVVALGYPTVVRLLGVAPPVWDPE